MCVCVRVRVCVVLAQDCIAVGVASGLVCIPLHTHTTQRGYECVRVCVKRERDARVCVCEERGREERKREKERERERDACVHVRMCLVCVYACARVCVCTGCDRPSTAAQEQTCTDLTGVCISDPTGACSC